MLILEQMIYGRALEALSWTLIHSLWQGCLLAIAAGSILLCTPKSAARTRYALLVGLFSLFLCTTLLTFVRQWTNSPDEPFSWTSSNPVSGTNAAHEATVTQDFPQETAGISWIAACANFLDSHASWVVGAWFLVFVVRFARLLGSLRHMQQVRRLANLVPGGEFWQAKIRQLASAMGISRQVRLLESRLVSVPMTSGILKPVILVPLGLLSQMAPDQLEVVLLHELAHIKRRDFLVNLLQHLAETIFFFNPALLWVSSLIRDERENCCDDLSLSVTGSRSLLVNALVAFQEKRLVAPQFAPAFSGRRYHLFNRINRIITQRNYTLDGLEKALLAACIFAGAMLAVGFRGTGGSSGQEPASKKMVTAGNPQDGKRDTSGNEIPAAPALIPLPPFPPLNGVLPQSPLDPRGIVSSTDTVPGLGEINSQEASDITAYLNGKKYRIVEAGDEIIALFIDGKKVPDDQISYHRAEIDKIREGFKQKASKQEILAYMESELALKQEKLAMESALLEAKRNAELLQLDSNTLNVNKKLAELAQQKALQEADLNAMQNMQQKKSMELMEIQSKKLKRMIEDGRLGSLSAEPSSVAGKSISVVINALKEANLISSSAVDLSFTLDEKGLIVNGKKQSDEVYRKFKARFLHHPGDHYIYSHSGTSTHTDVIVK